MPVAKKQIAIRISREAHSLMLSLVRSFNAEASQRGQKATQTEVLERAIRCLADQERVGGVRREKIRTTEK